jgi:D-glycero-alpha-D-manno-heptose-7-phosphate kinase
LFIRKIKIEILSFFGGGTDLPAYYEKHEGAVISAAIDKYIYVTAKQHSPLFQEAYRLSYSKTEHINSIDESIINYINENNSKFKIVN